MSERDLTREATNKQLVLDMWHEVIVRRDLAKAGDYIAQDYIQHSPSAGQGLKALVDFLKIELGGAEPRTEPVQRTPFEFVMAEGDLVQLMFKRPIPDPNKAGKMIHVWWYDTYRVKDGLIVEHWDSAIA
ncbi:MAG TPA: nuclear transport factor 2 family protein [Sphingobium sp.]